MYIGSVVVLLPLNAEFVISGVTLANGFYFYLLLNQGKQEIESLPFGESYLQRAACGNVSTNALNFTRSLNCPFIPGTTTVNVVLSPLSNIS